MNSTTDRVLASKEGLLQWSMDLFPPSLVSCPRVCSNGQDIKKGMRFCWCTTSLAAYLTWGWSGWGRRMSRTSRLVTLGHFSINAEAALSGVAQYFMVSMTTISLFQVIIDITVWVTSLMWHFAVGRKKMYAEVISTVPFLQTVHYLLIYMDF